MKPILEICAGDIRSVQAAAQGGAQRVELCSALSEGGLTPSYGLIKEALKIEGIKVNVLIRPRAGDFVYNDDELSLMRQDILAAKELGANGVVIGCLTPEGNVDIPACKGLMAAAYGLSVTFHRAFDLVADPFQALEEIIDLGCDRILTSGLSATATEGVDMLKDLIAKASNRIVIMPGSGVTASNAGRILQLAGASEIHASAREEVESGMSFRREGVNMGTPGADEYKMKYTSPKTVAQIVKAINSTEYE